MERTQHSQSDDRAIAPLADHLLPVLHHRSASIILLGPPGCGKGTQGKRISESLRIPLVSSGEILRANVRQRTTLGLQAKRAVDSGELVSDDIILEMLLCRILQPDCARGFVLDGVPRTTRQAAFLETQVFGREGARIPYVVLKLEMEDASLIKRITGRRVCPLCGATYNIETNPPLRRDKCDFDFSDLVLRADDRVEIFTRRLEEHRATSLEILSYLAARYGVIPEVECDRPIGQVTLRLLELIHRATDRPAIKIS